jgi:hypothetical protein
VVLSEDLGSRRPPPPPTPAGGMVIADLEIFGGGNGETTEFSFFCVKALEISFHSSFFKGY